MDMPIVSPGNTASLREPDGGFYAVISAGTRTISPAIMGLFPFETNANQFIKGASEHLNWDGNGYPPYRVIRVTMP